MIGKEVVRRVERERKEKANPRERVKEKAMAILGMMMDRRTGTGMTHGTSLRTRAT